MSYRGKEYLDREDFEIPAQGGRLQRWRTRPRERLNQPVPDPWLEIPHLAGTDDRRSLAGAETIA
jgi:hypothetical protein